MLAWACLRVGGSSPGTGAQPPRSSRDPGGKIVGYLNLTPRQGAERLADWARFRVRHDAEEGDLHVHILGRPQLRFAASSSRCVRDSYATKTGAHYVELACLVAGPRATTVIVGAAPPRDWRRVAPELARAFRRFRS